MTDPGTWPRGEDDLPNGGALVAVVGRRSAAGVLVHVHPADR